MSAPVLTSSSESPYTNTPFIKALLRFSWVEYTPRDHAVLPRSRDRQLIRIVDKHLNRILLGPALVPSSCVSFQKSEVAAKLSVLSVSSIPDIVMGSATTFPIPARSETEGVASTSNERNPPAIGEPIGGGRDGCAQRQVYTVSFFYPDHYLNAHQCHRYDHQWIPNTRR